MMTSTLERARKTDVSRQSWVVGGTRLISFSVGLQLDLGHVCAYECACVRCFRS